MDDWPVLKRYSGSSLRQISMPIGGIGTGFFALGGRGQLTDWQLMSRPARGWRPMYAHLLLWTKQGDDRKLRVLESDLTDGADGDSGLAETFAGIPRFQKAEFEAAYPFGRVKLTDFDTPVTATIEAFNPLIPHQTDDSSLPFGLLTIALANQTDKSLDASLSYLMSNVVGTDGIDYDLKDSVTEKAEAAGWKGMIFSKARQAEDPRFGTMAMLFDQPDVRVARRWKFRDRGWNGELLGIIDSLVGSGFIEDDEPDRPCPPSPQDTWDSSVSTLLSLGPRETKAVRFLVAWHFPYRNVQQSGWIWSGGHASAIRKNYYSLAFADATEVAAQAIPRLDALRAATVKFVSSVAARKAPEAMKEAALFNLTSLRGQTCFRLEDGTFFGFEGCSSGSGCCAGSCTHVWNYEEATVHLFPDLQRSMIETHVQYGLTPTGAERFRTSLPLKDASWGAAAADGQMGLIVRLYQQYTVDKDLDWLKKMYPAAKKMLEFAWVPEGWDADQDGVMEGCQHNTYDVEFFGPNPMMTSWYLAAMKAVAEMAKLCGDPETASKLDALRARGSAWVDEHLYNGRFYIQTVEPFQGDPAPMTTLGGEYKSKTPQFQVGKGCLVDQLVGQYKANRCGLGDLLDRFHIKTTAKSIFAYNYKTNFRDHYNNMRTFAYADEQGTLICSYPDGGRPEVPFPYWGECMTGFEYQAAVLMLDYGLKEEALKVVEGIRGRHAGHNRNPFNEPECGSYYARAMASWALLDAWDR
ncbi:MAG TPA: GH116 family glycosyl-hydrolase [Fimbriimonadaceae bacterium]|nr:GH116 family glycosyl-hydrolase [Fimbriimonadaceae bacterium]